MVTQTLSTRMMSAKWQQGAVTLPVALILLVLLTLITVFAAQVGVLETRTSANKQRAEESFAAAEALSQQAIRFIEYNQTHVVSTGTNGWLNAASAVKWEVCSASDPLADELPCADETTPGLWMVVKNVPVISLDTSCVDKDSDDNSGNGVDNIPNGLCDSDTTKFSAASGKQLYVHLMARCRNANNDNSCDDTPARPNDYPIMTIVAGGESGDESGKSYVTESVFFYESGTDPSSFPAPLVAAGNITGGGNFNIVVNPDIGKDNEDTLGSNKLAVWAEGNVTVGSSSATCYEGEPGVNGFLTNATGTSTTHESVDAYVPSNTQVHIIQNYYGNGESLYLCRNCACPSSTANGAISPPSSTEEDDILDQDSNSGRWLDTAFPDDVFMMIFGIPEERYNTIKDAAIRADHKYSDCSSLGTSSEGLYWIDGDCLRTASDGDIGSPSKPVIIVVEGNVEIRSNVYIWGVFFAFSPTHATLDVNLNGSPTFYGSLISNTNINMSSGTYKQRYIPNLFDALSGTTGGKGYARLPGSWRDY